MAAGESAAPQTGEPYRWDDGIQVPPEAVKLWSEVETGIDKNQTVVWKNAVESLDAANRFITASEDARRFVEGYMKDVIGILVEQQPAKIGTHERSCVEDSLKLAVIIIARDLKIQQDRSGECQLLEVLSTIFNRKRSYYKGAKGSWNNHHLQGLPEVRLRMIEEFRNENGFSRLAEYLKARIGSPMFPSLDLLHQILNALSDSLPNRQSQQQQQQQQQKLNDPMQVRETAEEDAVLVAQATMAYIASFTDDTLRKHPGETITLIRTDLQKIFDRLVGLRRKDTYGFYAFWRDLILKLISSESLPLRLTGWDQLKDLIEASAEHRPPPRSFAVTNAGCSFVNGVYKFAGEVTEDGYARKGVEIKYVLQIPEVEKDGGGKSLTLFRCTMRSQQKWWFLSEADEEQPGTDRDIDYYQHKSKEHEETQPPQRGWVTCRNAGVDPPPVLQGSGLMVPAGEEYNTLEHQLARWAIENKIVELVLGASLHREVVHRSIPLIEFLASMCERDESGRGDPNGPGPNAYCLDKSHLLLAWKTCTSKADAAISDEIYQLLVSILPSLPNGLAIPLLQAVLASLRDIKRDSLFEVAEFCGALALMPPPDAKNPIVLSADVRANILELLWAVLTHPDAYSLKAYDNLKRYITSELRVEPLGRVHREKFLQSCTQALQANTQQQSGGGRVDEVSALRMVKLTQFVLDACPRQHAEHFVTQNKGGLASLIFNELTSFLTRRKADLTMSPVHVQKRTTSAEAGKVDASALSERLRILRCVYGISEQVKLSIVQLQHLWQLCSIPGDREELMVFIARASAFTQTNARTAAAAAADGTLVQQSAQASNESALSAAFSEDVRTSAFLDLFCSETVDWAELRENAYQSFQMMFTRMRQSPGTALESSGPSLDALWRICLTAGNESVASQSMKDLLVVYAAMATINKNSSWSDGSANNSGPDTMQTDDNDNDFGIRVFDCLVKVKKGLDAGDMSSERSAERCLRILNAAVGQDGSSGRSVTASTISSMTELPPRATLGDVIGLLPHGMRGQSCYRRIGIVVKRTTMQSQSQGVQTQDKEGVHQAPRHPTTLRFTLDVHPLETLASLKSKVAQHCRTRISAIKPISVSGRLAGTVNRTAGGDQTSQMTLSSFADDTAIDQLGVASGCEMLFMNAERQNHATNSHTSNKVITRKPTVLEVSDLFNEKRGAFADRLFQTLLSVLQALPWQAANRKSVSGCDTHKLVWDLLLAMPTNPSVVERVRAAAGMGSQSDAMVVDSTVSGQWGELLDKKSFQRSVYVLQTIDAFLQPAPEILSCLDDGKRGELERSMSEDAIAFRRGFIETGGFNAVVDFFSTYDYVDSLKQSQTRMGNAAALRILMCCLFGNGIFASGGDRAGATSLDDIGVRLLQSLSSAQGLLRSLAAMVVGDKGISSSTISDVVTFLRLLFQSPKTTEAFVSLPDRMSEKFVITLLLWDGGHIVARMSTGVSTASKIRKSMHDLILSIPLLARYALPWLSSALDVVDVTSDSTEEYFDALKKLVGSDEAQGGSLRATPGELEILGTAVCNKLASCPRPSNGSAAADVATGVLCGCLGLLQALIGSGSGGRALAMGTTNLLASVKLGRWSEQVFSSPQSSRASPDDRVLIDLMGVIFDGFLSPSDGSFVAICCDKDSRRAGFSVIAAAARSCRGNDGYTALVNRVNRIIKSAVPFIRHRWGQLGGADDSTSRSASRNSSEYSGLRNQGCTCYMNSFLQQVFMMPDLKKEICDSPLPESLRSTGGVAKGAELVDKKITLQWDSGVSYDAIVEAFDEETGMHTIRYCPLQIANVGGPNHQHVQPDDINKMPAEFPDEFILAEGRPGKETGVFEVVGKETNSGENTSEGVQPKKQGSEVIEETEDEASARRLFEEVQRTFIHLEGSRGRCFDPRALVEACACLKLEFDVWQQNDASEFAMKLLDRMEIALKRWAPSHFRNLKHTFGLKQTKQKVCKECGLKTNREENLMSIDCQIRGKSDINEALATMCEVEYMEGNNKVFCDRCKKNTDTVLRTAISALPDMLILSLKRFDLDYNTFETVKLNSRCAFGQTLNMKKYTLEGVEAVEKGSADESTRMETDDEQDTADPLSSLPDEKYEYKLAGVLVHAGVAQGGHYYSFIKDRSGVKGEPDKWYKFDDEDVTPFDPALIEVECFGGKVKKESKWPSGEVRTVESEQFANALMLFYEKVQPTMLPEEEEEEKEKEKSKENGKQQERKIADMKVVKSSGFDAFNPDVQRSNATHKWQTFLFDNEFQFFLKGLLDMCRRSNIQSDEMDTEGSVPSNSLVPWQSSVIDMLLTFFLDVLLYSADRSSFGVWVAMLSETLSQDRDSARRFVHSLALKTQKVSSNWLRTYVSDCPEQDACLSAIKIFAVAIRSCLESESEKAALSRWSQAWNEMKNTFGMRPLTTNLQGKFQAREDLRSLGAVSGGKISTVGAIISFINLLIELGPRTWRYNSELCVLIRNIASSKGSGGPILRAALNAAEVPARLICLILRDRSPQVLRASFPGASVAFEVADTQIRQETNPNAHLLPLGGNQMMSNDLNARGPPGGSYLTSDFLSLFEAIGCIVGDYHMVVAPLVVEAAEQSRSGRISVVLSEAAAGALRDIFEESRTEGSPGMDQHDIETYLQKCGLDSAAIPQQKIIDLLSKYPTAPATGMTQTDSYLSLEGFLAYYRDTAQTNEARVRADLHAFGFRPDLSRIAPTARADGLIPTEGVCMDCLSKAGSDSEHVTKLTEEGLNVLSFFFCAYSASEWLAEYLVASTSIGRDTMMLLVSCLKTMYRAPGALVGNETWSAVAMIVRVLASIPDDQQKARIGTIMRMRLTNADRDIGLLLAARQFASSRQQQNFSSEIQYTYERYVGVVKELRKIKAVADWMSENRELWSWMERDLTSSDEGNSQRRNDFSGRREGAALMDPRADANDVQQMNESEDDDDDEVQRLYDVQKYHGTEKIFVKGAGLEAINGLYVRDGEFEGAGKYTKKGILRGDEEDISLFRCNVSNNTKHWYLSIVPDGVQPGTNTDIDFYSAPVSDQVPEFPPQTGWTKAHEGVSPAPTVTIKTDGLEERRVWTNNDASMNDKNQGGRGGHVYI